jgi:DNA-nicking Smr family endonuclease
MMMNFEDILSQWEQQQRYKSAKDRDVERKKSAEVKAAPMDDWLEMYPPDRKLAERKEIPDRIIIHTRKKELARMDPQDTLDLHGWTGQEALSELEYFLKKSKRKGLNKVMVVHGKGLHSPGGASVLRPIVKNYLEKSPLVRDYGRAKLNSGGGGATWILLR